MILQLSMFKTRDSEIAAQYTNLSPNHTDTVNQAAFSYYKDLGVKSYDVTEKLHNITVGNKGESMVANQLYRKRITELRSVFRGQSVWLLDL